MGNIPDCYIIIQKTNFTITLILINSTWDSFVELVTLLSSAFIVDS